jgi:hypothetical protein
MENTPVRPLKSGTFRVWLYSSRTAQLIIAVVVLGLSISVVDEWNQNQLNFNSILSGNSAGSLKITTWVGNTPLLALSCIL